MLFAVGAADQCLISPPVPMASLALISRRTVNCPVCGVVCESGREMSEHLTKLHGTTCWKCFAICSSEDCLRQHTLACHGLHKPYVCQLCPLTSGKEFCSRTEYRMHLANLHDFPYGCTECSYVSLTQIDYAVHFVTMHTPRWTAESRVKVLRQIQHVSYSLGVLESALFKLKLKQHHK